jgi:hypothetical protein
MTAAAVVRARGYPWHARAPEAASPARFDAAVRAGAVGVLAYGSNASPAVLRRKLGEEVAAAVVARRVVLRDADVVYSAHISAHGAIPGTLHPSPGTEVDAWLLAVPSHAMPALDATEPNYRRRPYAGAHAYLSRHGALRVDDGPVALAAVPARGRRLRALAQGEMLECVRRTLAPEESPDGFVRSNVLDDALRTRRTEKLRGGL